VPELLASRVQMEKVYDPGASPDVLQLKVELVE
jgi:hypothetical protein